MAECIIMGNGGGCVGSEELTATKAYVLNGYTYVGSDTNDEIGTGTMVNNGAVTHSITPSGSAQSYTIQAGYHNGFGKVTVAAVPNQVWTGWRQICNWSAKAVNMDTEVEADFDLDASFANYNTFIFRVSYTSGKTSSAKGTYTYQNTFIACRKADDTSSHALAPNKTKNASSADVYGNIEFSVGVTSDNQTVSVSMLYDGDSDTETRYGWFEVVLIAALKL